MCFSVDHRETYPSNIIVDHRAGISVVSSCVLSSLRAFGHIATLLYITVSSSLLHFVRSIRFSCKVVRKCCDVYKRFSTHSVVGGLTDYFVLIIMWYQEGVCVRD